MRWWVRLLVTLVLAPPLWWLASAYLASQRGAEWADLLPAVAGALPGTYLAYSLLALPLLALLAAADAVLVALGLGLLTVAVSPALAALAAGGALRLARAAGSEAPARLLGSGFSLLVVYGLVWGLTIREPRRGRPARRGAAAPPAA